MTGAQAPADTGTGPVPVASVPDDSVPDDSASGTEAEDGCEAGPPSEVEGDAVAAGEVEWYEQPLSTDAEAAADPALAPPPLTPAQAFDALYAYCAPALVQQTYLLTGSLRQARDAVERAFQQAWQCWPEVAVDRDPAGWVRAVAHDCALSPWHQLRHRLPVPFRSPEPGPEPTPTDPAGRALLAELQRLRPPYRRALVLYDGVGLDLPEAAAETEASTPATAGRVEYARAVVTACLPEPAAPEELHRLLTELAADVRPRPTRPIALRTRADLRARRWIYAAVVFAGVLLTTTALTLRTAPDHYEPPVPPGAPVSGVPPRVAPGPLSAKQLKLRSKLRAATAAGPERLHPEAR
ncbi:RNA polymerase sigma factor [Streptomyces heilongjiangensis]|uniref:RNA polymerase sigma factor n=1 Tax=Streptomyces heilongjiangensis TaxID=945052 RepID=A0ABW1B8F5_9ACTN|nr:sigma-70 family RNA polymerase sigma factor [Streptomyces heilongjiangensis]MDC2947183.1 sigma-70 family RNA polymerase sigma factor [Streptomyces heilongjiangensis]